MQTIENIDSSHETGSQIQFGLAKLPHTKKVVVMFWVESHVNMEGNEEADRTAKEVTTSDRQVDCMHIPYADYYRDIKRKMAKRMEWHAEK